MQTNQTPAQQVTKMSGEERLAARKAVGKTQMNIAVECGVSLQTARLWESGIQPNPENAVKYAAALGITSSHA